MILRGPILLALSLLLPPQAVILYVEGAPSLGDKDARVTLIEFSDYQCPFCGRQFRQTFPQILNDYVKTGKVKYVFRDFPLDPIHPAAFKAAEAAHCAGDQGKFWEMNARLFFNQRALGPKDLQGYAQDIGLDMLAFQRCFEIGKNAPKVMEGLNEGRKAGVQGTPAVFLGLTERNGSKVKALRAIDGAVPYAVFQ